MLRHEQSESTYRACSRRNCGSFNPALSLTDKSEDQWPGDLPVATQLNYPLPAHLGYLKLSSLYPVDLEPLLVPSTQKNLSIVASWETAFAQQPLSCCILSHGGIIGHGMGAPTCSVVSYTGQQA